MTRQAQKHAGAYYTPDPVVATLLKWAIRSDDDRMLDPSCGDGRFIAGHRNSVGIEQNSTAAAQAISRAPWALVHEGDFFTWAMNTTERFDCAAGNPPFIRYQTFKGEIRERALGMSHQIGASFSGLASSWAPYSCHYRQFVEARRTHVVCGAGGDWPCTIRCAIAGAHGFEIFCCPCCCGEEEALPRPERGLLAALRGRVWRSDVGVPILCS